MEAKIHRDLFSLFYSVLYNPDSKIYQIVKYLLENSPENSRTWAVHLRYLSFKYGLLDPLECLKVDPPPKSHFKEHVQTKICAYYENKLRTNADNNSLMEYLNVSLTGLRGRHHPALSGIITTQEVQKSRIHLKMLAGNYFTYEIKSIQSGGSPHCRCCVSSTPANENLIHILTICDAYSDIRDRIMIEYQDLCNQTKNAISFQDIFSEGKTLCQFILDPASFNLKTRVHMNDPVLLPLFKTSRGYCYAVNARRMKLLKEKANAASL